MQRETLEFSNCSVSHILHEDKQNDQHIEMQVLNNHHPVSVYAEKGQVNNVSSSKTEERKHRCSNKNTNQLLLTYTITSLTLEKVLNGIQNNIMTKLNCALEGSNLMTY